MDHQSHQNSSDPRTQTFEDRSKNVWVDEHKHKSVAETGQERNDWSKDLSRQHLATHSDMLKANSEDPVAVEENIHSEQHNNIYNLRTEGSSLSRNATNVAQPLRTSKIKYQSVAQLSESGVFTAKTKPPRYSRSNSKKNKSKSAGASQKLSKRRGDLEPLQEVISPDHEVLLRASKLARDASYRARSSSFWKKVEPIFASVREEDTSYLLKELKLSEELHETQPQIPRSQENILDTLMSTSAGESNDQYHDADYSSSGITLLQIVLSAIISEDDIKEVEDNEEFDYSHLADLDETHVRKIQYDFSDIEYEKLDPNDKVRLELQSIDLYPEFSSSKEIDNEIVQLQQSLHQQNESKMTYLMKIYELVRRSWDAAKRSLEHVAMDKLVQVTYQKLLHTGAGKRATQAILRRLLARCQEFERGGVSCFNDPPLLDVLLSAPRAEFDAEFVTTIASTSTKSSGNKATGRRSPRLSQIVLLKADGPSEDSLSGVDQNKRNCRRKASTPSPGEVLEASMEIFDHADSSLQELEGIKSPEDFLDFEDDVLGDDFSIGLDIPMDDLSSIDMSIP